MSRSQKRVYGADSDSIDHQRKFQNLPLFVFREYTNVRSLVVEKYSSKHGKHPTEFYIKKAIEKYHAKLSDIDNWNKNGLDQLTFVFPKQKQIDARIWLQTKRQQNIIHKNASDHQKMFLCLPKHVMEEATNMRSLLNDHDFDSVYDNLPKISEWSCILDDLKFVEEPNTDTSESDVSTERLQVDALTNCSPNSQRKRKMNSTADDEMNQSQNEVSQTTKRPKKESDDNGMGKTAVTSSVNMEEGSNLIACESTQNKKFENQSTQTDAIETKDNGIQCVLVNNNTNMSDDLNERNPSQTLSQLKLASLVVHEIDEAQHIFVQGSSSMFGLNEKNDVFIDQNPQDMEVGHDITENDILSQTTEGLTSIVDDLRAQQILVPSNSLTKEANAQLPKLMLTSPSKIKKENEIPSPKPHTQTQSQTRSTNFNVCEMLRNFINGLRNNDTRAHELIQKLVSSYPRPK